MNRYILFIALTAGVLPVIFPQPSYGQNGEDITDQNSDVSMTITKFYVNDQNLELSWKIVNNSDQDVWICDSVVFIKDEFELFMEDDQNLLIRRRLDVPTIPMFYIWPEGRYIRLRSGDEMVKSLSITLPVHNHWIFWPTLGEGGLINAQRLVVEIGYHTKDLAKMILELQGSDEDLNIIEKLGILYLHSVNGGEQVLRVTVDGVHIPYEDVWTQNPHGNDQPGY